MGNASLDGREELSEFKEFRELKDISDTHP